MILRSFSIVIKERALWKEAIFNVRGGDKLVIIVSNGTGKIIFIKKLFKISQIFKDNIHKPVIVLSGEESSGSAN